MSDYERSIFISYAWGGESEEVVNQIDRAFQTWGVKLIRDKRDLGYKGSISEFMKRIGLGNCVIVVISDKYLRSPHCMFELMEIAEGKQFHDRIFPVVLTDADIYDAVKRLDYVKHWEAKRAELAQKMQGVDPANLQGIRDDMDLYDRIRDKVSGLASILRDMNTLTPEMHRDSDFLTLYAAIGERMNWSVVVPESVKYSEPETILIPEGQVWMGYELGETVPEYETPRHEVTLSSYRIGKYPITNAQYKEFTRQTKRAINRAMEWDDQRIPRGLESQPVMGVTLDDAKAYCEWLSMASGRTYSIPNEAQLERAYQIPDGCEDIVQNLYQWTCTLWGAKALAPDAAYRYPWKDNDGRNNLQANSQIRRVVCMYFNQNNVGSKPGRQRWGKFSWDAGFQNARHAFRVVLMVSHNVQDGH